MTTIGSGTIRFAGFAMRIVVAWMAVSAIAWVGGRHVIEALFPVFEIVVSGIGPGIASTFEATREGHDWMIRMRPMMLETLRFDGANSVLRGALLPWFSTHLTHALLPPVLMLALVLGWPEPDRRALLARFVIALPLAVVLVLLIPVHLVGLVEMRFQDVAGALGADRATPSVVHVIVFLESGGRWLAALLGAALCIGLAATTRATAARVAGAHGAP